MALKVKASSGNSNDLPEAEPSPAVCVAVIDLGSHEETYEDKERGSSRTSTIRKIYILWELLGQPQAGSTFNHVIGKTYSLSLGPKSALRALLKGWGKDVQDGMEFDPKDLLRQAAQVNIVHEKSKTSDRVYAKLASVSKLPKGMQAQAPTRKPVYWEISEDPNQKLPEQLTWLPFIYGEPALEVIRRSQEWKAKAALSNGNEQAIPDDGPDDPF